MYCGQDLSQLRLQSDPFIDNCPMCAEPVRGGSCRGGGGRGGQGSLSPLARWVIGGLFVGLLVVAGRWGFRGDAGINDQQAVERAKADAEAERRARTVVISVSRLLREFQNDPRADQKYRGKYLELIGVVERSGKDREDIPFVILTAGDEKAELKIECFFDAADEENETRIQRLRRGQEVTVRGEYTGRISHLQIRDCVLVKK